MAYNLESLTATVRKRIKDTSFAADLIADYLNETQHQVLQRHRFPFMEIADTDNVSQGDTEVELDEEIDTIVALSLLDSDDNVTRPDYVPYAVFYDRYDPETASDGQPCHYTIFGRTIVFDVPADKAYTLQVKYIKTAEVMSLPEDEPEIPERFKELLIRGAMARVEEYRDNYDIAALHERRVEELTEDMVYHLSLRQLAHAPRSKFSRRRVDIDEMDWRR